jgi:hypothetical protein
VALAFSGVGQRDHAQWPDHRWGHSAQFGVTTGAVLALPALAPVSAYRLRVDHDDTIVEI